MNPYRMIVSGDRLVVYEDRAERPFRVFPLPLCEESYAAGFRGRGPGEILSPDAKSFVVLPTGFQFADNGGFLRTASFSGDSLLIQSTAVTGWTRAALNGAVAVGQGYINLSLDPSNGYEYDYIDGQTGDVSFVGQTPEWADGTAADNPMSSLQFLARKPDGTQLVVFYAFHNRIRIFDNRMEIQKELMLPMDGIPYPTQERKLYYSTYCSADQPGILARFGETEYHLFNWHGKMMARYELDVKLDLFAFDFNTHTLYGIYKQDGEFKMIRAVLSE